MATDVSTVNDTHSRYASDARHHAQTNTTRHVARVNAPAPRKAGFESLPLDYFLEKTPQDKNPDQARTFRSGCVEPFTRAEALAALASQIGKLTPPGEATKRFHSILRACGDLLADAQKASVLAGLAQSIERLPAGANVDAFWTLITAVRALPPACRATPLAALAVALRWMPCHEFIGSFDAGKLDALAQAFPWVRSDDAQVDRFNAVVAAYDGLTDKDKSAVLACLPGSFKSLWPLDRSAAFRFVFAAASELKESRGAVLAALVRQLKVAPAQFGDMLQASLELPTLEERAEGVLGLSGSLPDLTPSQTHEGFRTLLAACDLFPDELQPSIVAALAPGAAILDGTGTKEACLALLKRNDSFDSKHQHVILPALARSIHALADEHWALEFFDLVMLRSSQQDGCASEALARSIINLPPEYILDRFQRLGQDQQARLQRDRNFQAAMRSSMRWLSCEDRRAAEVLLSEWTR
ncbi:MAG TPA: hypothetical protein VF169_04725 [Albitalea sp.]|uniref:hypothetical protein n=1 Tax=Piscinibacter sp. TaxID=1903157 RepID=UPI002ED14A81